MKNNPTPLTDKFIADLKSQVKSGRIKKKNIAKGINVSPQMFSNWMSRRRNPNGEHVLQLQKFLKDGFLLVVASLGLFFFRD